VSITFNSSELINIAIGIEQRGVAFYDVLLKSTRNRRLAKVLQELLDTERRHTTVFQEMLAGADDAVLHEPYTEEYAAYLQALVDSAVFTQEKLTGEVATHLRNDAEALEMALDLEKDSILLYYELKELVPLTSQPVLNDIITEERKHLRYISHLRNTLVS